MYAGDSETTIEEVYIYMHVFSDTDVIMCMYTHMFNIKHFVFYQKRDKRGYVYSADPSSHSACWFQGHQRAGLLILLCGIW